MYSLPTTGELDQTLHARIRADPSNETVQSLYDSLYEAEQAMFSTTGGGAGEAERMRSVLLGSAFESARAILAAAMK